jgi:hypothetical protein
MTTVLADSIQKNRQSAIPSKGLDSCFKSRRHQRKTIFVPFRELFELLALATSYTLYYNNISSPKTTLTRGTFLIERFHRTLSSFLYYALTVGTFPLMEHSHFGRETCISLFAIAASAVFNVNAIMEMKM